MPTQYPALPNIDPEEPTALGDALDYLGRFRSAAEERDSSIQALAFSPDGSLWQGRSLPSTSGAVAQPTGLQAFGLYDNIALVWDFDPDPAILGWEITRDGTVRDVATDFSYVDRPGDTSSHTYTVKAVRADGTRSIASASAATSAVTSETTARANYAAAVLARQSAAVRPGAIIEAAIAAGSVTSTAIASGAVTASDLDQVASFTKTGSGEEVLATVTVPTDGGFCAAWSVCDGGAAAGTRFRLRKDNTSGTILADLTTPGSSEPISLFGADVSPSASQVYVFTSVAVVGTTFTHITLLGINFKR